MRMRTPLVVLACCLSMHGPGLAEERTTGAAPPRLQVTFGTTGAEDPGLRAFLARLREAAARGDGVAIRTMMAPDFSEIHYDPKERRVPAASAAPVADKARLSNWLRSGKAPERHASCNCALPPPEDYDELLATEVDAHLGYFRHLSRSPMAGDDLCTPGEPIADWPAALAWRMQQEAAHADRSRGMLGPEYSFGFFT